MGLQTEMKLLERIVDLFVRRMSQAEKEALIERAIEKFFSDMPPEDKQRLIERMLSKLLEDIDMKEFLPRIMLTMWKGAGTDEEKAGMLETMSKMVGDTGGKISGMVSSKVKDLIRKGKEIPDQ